MSLPGSRTSPGASRPSTRAHRSALLALWAVALLMVLALGGSLSLHQAQAASSPAPTAVPQTATIRDQTSFYDACLNVTKTVSATTANIGDTVTYTLTVTNNQLPPSMGNFNFTCTTATNPSLSDLADNNVAFQAGSLTVTPASGFSCTLTSGSLHCTSGSLATTDTVTISFKATITGCGSTSNYATFTAANAIFLIPPFFFTQTGTSNGVVTSINCPDVLITKTLAPDTNVPALIGGTVHYVIVARNQGTAPAAGVIISDVVPAGYAFASAVLSGPTPTPPTSPFTACSYFSGTNTVNCGGLSVAGSNTLAPGQAVTVDLRLTLLGCQPGPNTATVTSSTPESDFNGTTDVNNSVTAPPPAVKCPNLTLAKTASAPAVASGSTFSYNLTVTNTGNAAVQPPNPVEPPIIVTDTVPGSLTLLSVAGQRAGDWSCTITPPGSNTFSCQWTGTSAGGAGGLDNQPPNNVTSPIVVTVRAPSLNPGAANQTICNTAAVNGTVDANGVFHPFPGPTPAPVPETNSTDNTSRVCVTATPPSAAPEPIPGITKTADQTSAATGGFVTYTLTVTNTGNAAMTNVTVTDQLPPNVTIQNPPGVTVNPTSSGFVCSYSPTTLPVPPAPLAATGQLISCTGGTVPAGGTVTITYVVQIEACGTVSNTATIQSYRDADDDAEDLDDTPVTSTPATVVTVTNCPSLTITKSGPATVPNTQALVAYTVTVRNTGPGGATGVTLVDTLGPASAIGTFWTVQPSQGTCGAPVLTAGNDVITCSLGNLAPNGGTATLNMLVQLQGGSFCAVTNTATAFGFLNGIRADAIAVDASGAPSATGATVVTTLPCPNVTITKTFLGSDSRTGFGATGIVPDTHAQWAIVVTNTSPTVQALGTVVRDVIDHPEDFVTLAATVSPTTAGSCVTNLNSNATATTANTLTNVTCTLGTLVPGASVTITLDALAQSSPVACTVNDTARVTTSNGNLAGAAQQSATAGPTPVLCSSITLTKAVTAVNGGTPTTAGTPPVAQALPGDTVTYTITVTNPGSNTLSNIAVTDTAPAGLAFVANSAVAGPAFSGLVCTTTTTAVSCTGGTLAGGTSGTVTLQATVLSTRPTPANPSAPNCGPAPLTNTATVTGTNTFTQRVTASGSVGLNVLCAGPQVKKVLTDGAGNVVTTATAGTNAPYHYLITVTNNGTFSTPVEIRDVLPADEDVNCPSLPIGSCLPGPFSNTGAYGTWACTVTGTPPAQETVDCRLSGDLAGNGGQVILDLPVSFGGPSRTDTNCAEFVPLPGQVLETGSVTRGCVTIEVTSSNFHPTLTIAKTCAVTGTPAASITANFGDTVTCTLVITNTGNAGAEQVTLTDVTPAGLTLTPSPTNPSSTGGTTALTCTASTATQVSCSGGVLASQGNTGYQATITVAYTVSGCAPITNTATVNFQTGTAVTSAPATITPQCASLSVTKGSPHNANGTVTAIDTAAGPMDVIYDIAVSNSSAAGTGHTVALKVTDTLPTGGSYDAATTTLPAGWSCSANAATPQTVTCTANAGAQLAAGGSATLHLEVRYAYPTSCPASVTNTATASDASGATNTSAGSTLPVYCADIAVAAGPGNVTGTTSGFFTQSFTVTNTGTTAAATNVTLHLVLSETAGLSATVSGMTATGGGSCHLVSNTPTSAAVDCTWPSIPAGQQYAATVSGIFTNTNACGATLSFTASTDPAHGGAEPNVLPDADDTATAALSPPGNLVCNGSFETPVGFTIQSSIPGWTAVARPAPFTQVCASQVEVDPGQFMPPAQGSQSEELNANCASAIQQTVTTTAGHTYTLRFAYAARPGTVATDNIVCAYWNGVQLGCVGPTTNTNWTYTTFTVTGTGSDSLIFSSGDTVAPGSSVGSEIDDVSLS